MTGNLHIMLYRTEAGHRAGWSPFTKVTNLDGQRPVEFICRIITAILIKTFDLALTWKSFPSLSLFISDSWFL